MELLLTAPNIQVYDFSYRIDIIENLDNYTDTLHYGEWINSGLEPASRATRFTGGGDFSPDIVYSHIPSTFF